MSPKKIKMELSAGLHQTKSRGKTYWYWRPNRKAAQKGKEKLISMRLPGSPTSPEFWSKLQEIGALTNADETPKLGIQPGTVSALIRDYQNDIAFTKLAAKTKKEYRRYHKIFLEMWADIQVSKIKPKHVLVMRNEFSDTPYKANYMLRCLSALLSWGVPMDYLDLNPCRDVKLLGRKLIN